MTEHSVAVSSFVARRPAPRLAGRLAGLGRGGGLLLLTIAVGAVHHLDHVLRADHSGWPFVPLVTPFTYSLLAYPVLLAALLLRSRPWARVGLVAGVLLLTQAAHVLVETPYHQYALWAHIHSPEPTLAGSQNLLGIASPLLGLVAAGWSILLSVAMLASLVVLVREARREAG